MTRTRLTLAAAAITLLTLTACSGSDEPTAQDRRIAIGSGQLDTEPSASELLDLNDLGLDPDGGLPPEPTGETRDQYLAEVRTLAPDLTEMSLIAAGRDVCQLQQQGAYDLTDTIAAQLSATEEDADALIAAAEQHICS